LKEYNKIWKSLQQQLTPEEHKSFQAWKDSSPSNNELFDDVSTIWKESENLENIRLIDAEMNWAEFEQEIEEKKAVNIQSIRWIGIAASFLLISSLVIWYFISKQDPLYESFVTGNEKAEIQLADGSKVNLDKNSSLKYFTRVDEGLKDRRVYVNGKAKFEVAKDSLLPFVVEMVETGITVLGTTFKIDQKDSSEITVENIEGLIKFYELANEENSIILKKGDKIKYVGSSFVNLNPPKKRKAKGKIFSVEQVIEILLSKYDGRFNTGPYGNFDLDAKVRVDLDQPLETIMHQLSLRANVEYTKTCPNCYELSGLNLPK